MVANDAIDLLIMMMIRWMMIIMIMVKILTVVNMASACGHGLGLCIVACQGSGVSSESHLPEPADEHPRQKL